MGVDRALSATQPEILRYLNHVADRFDLRRDILFDTRVTAARFDEAADRWMSRPTVARRCLDQLLITAVGCLSTARIPDFRASRRSRARSYHTGPWPHDGVDFTGKRVR